MCFNLMIRLAWMACPMDDDFDLRGFSNRCRLFPLSRVVLFPHAVLPLHIFEPRYRQMTEDALATDKLVTIVQLQNAPGPASNPGLGLPAIESVGCIGRILQHERLPDGCFNFLLLGRKRVRLTREIPSDKLYRIAKAEIIDDLDDESDSDEPHRAELVALFRRIFERHNEVDPYLAALLENQQPMGILTDIIAHALGLPPIVKQRFLDEPRVGHRVEALRTILRQAVERDSQTQPAPKPFPPPFSVN